MSNNFAENLKNLRIKKNLLQKEIAKILNVTNATYCNYEKGKTEADYNALFCIADFFNVSIDTLLGYKKNYVTTDLLTDFEKDLLNTVKTFDFNQINILMNTIEFIKNIKNYNLTDYENSVINKLRKMSDKELEVFNIYFNFINEKNS